MRIYTEDVNFNYDLPYLIRKFSVFHREYPVHFHDDVFELTLTLGCSGTRIVGDHISSFGDPDLVFIPPGLSHSWHNHHQDLGGDFGPVVLVIHFGRDLFPGSWLQSREFSGIRQLLARSGGGLLFDREITRNILGAILELNEERTDHSLLGLLGVLNRLGSSGRFSPITQARLDTPGKEKEKELFNRIFEYISLNYRNRIRIAEPAALAGLSESAFSHYFKKRTLKSFTRYITELRLAYADQLLLHSDMSITGIAYESGFESISTFNRSYLKFRGSPPGQVRKVLKSG